MDLLLSLKQVKVSVSYPITDVFEKTIQNLEAVEGQRHLVLFSFAPDHTVRILNENQLCIFGREMARFHNLSSTIELGKARWTFDLETTVFKSLKRLKSAFAADPKAYNWLQQVTRQAEEKLSKLNTSGFSL